MNNQSISPSVRQSVRPSVHQSISVLVCAHNEAGQLAECLSHLSFADEIVVVLDRCTDASRAVALMHNARLVEGAWEREGPRRAAGQNACTGDWILEVDADERVSAELAIEILETIQSVQAMGHDFYRIPFHNYVGARLVKYGWGAQFGVSAKICLFRKGAKSWQDQRLHPKVSMTGQNGGVLTQPMVHLVDKNISDLLQRLDRYTNLHAQDLAQHGYAGTLAKNMLRVLGRFYKCYVLRQGWREGGLGFLIAICAGLYPLISYLKMMELRK